MTRKAELSERVAKLRQVDESKESLGKIVREYRQAFDSLTYENKIELIREFTERIVVYDGGKIVVTSDSETVPKPSRTWSSRYAKTPHKNARSS